jgi:phosphatidylserine/phosphatidylglycerophosphate/cardiolipin synthase-like enzyme
MRKSIPPFYVFIFFVLFLTPSLSYPLNLTLNKTPTQIYFSPNGGCTEAIIQEIGKAKMEILVQAYSFTSQPIAKAILFAHKRGLKIQVIFDRSQNSDKHTSAAFVSNVGISTYVDSAYVIAHNKVMIIDRETVITGTFNFTRAAESKSKWGRATGSG